MGGFTCPSTSQPPATSASQNRETWPSPLTIPVSAGGTHSSLPCSKGGVEGLTFSPDFPHTDIWTWPKAVVWILGWLHNGALLVGISCVKKDPVPPTFPYPLYPTEPLTLSRGLDCWPNHQCVCVCVLCVYVAYVCIHVHVCTHVCRVVRVCMYMYIWRLCVYVSCVYVYVCVEVRGQPWISAQCVSLWKEPLIELGAQ